MRINLNEFAKEVAKREGKKRSLPIGQIKEVQRIILEMMGEKFKANPIGVMQMYVE